MTQEELKHIAPKLAELKQLKTGFDTPKKYLDDVEDMVFFKINSDNENSMSVPDGYFDSLEDEVFSKINSEPKVISLKNRLIKRVIPVMTAASILLFISIQLLNNTNTTSDPFSEIAFEDVDNWIESGDLDISLYELASTYETTSFENIEIIENEYSDDELIDYLEDIDLESLILTN